MRLFVFPLLAFFVFINIHVLALINDQEIVAEERKISKPALRNQHDSFFRKPVESIGKTERAVAYYGTERKIDGVRARINVWQPLVDQEKAYSSSQIWIVSDEDDANNNKRNMIEVGLHVFPRYYRDNKTRLFIHWTTWRGGRELGCYNLNCTGFVQHDRVNEIGKSYDTVSTYDGLQRFITIQVKRAERGHWSLIVDNVRVGYWPNHIFTRLSEGASGVHWGGETWIMNPDDDENTIAWMGSGRFAEQGYRRASCFNKLAVAFHSINNGEFIPLTLDNMALTMTSPCYNIIKKNDIAGEEDNIGFFYGGPGIGPNCTADT